MCRFSVRKIPDVSTKTSKMRFSLFLLCSVFLIIKHETVDGQLIKDFFGKVHETAQKVRQDIRKVLRPNSDQGHVNTVNNTPIFFDSHGDSSPSQVQPVSSTKPSQINTKQPEHALENAIPDDDSVPTRTDLSTTSTTSEPEHTNCVFGVMTEEIPSTTKRNAEGISTTSATSKPVSADHYLIVVTDVIPSTTKLNAIPIHENATFIFPDDDSVLTPTDISTTSTTSKSVSTDDVLVFVTEEVPSTTTKKTARSGDDDKDSRENFSAGCLTGYVRTPDGRCMPNF